MKPAHFLRQAFVVPAVLLLGGAPAAMAQEPQQQPDTPVALKLTREKKVGERYYGRTRFVDKAQMEFYANERPLQPTANYLEAELEGTEEILQVSKMGKPTEIKVIVSKVIAKRTENGPPEIFPCTGIPLRIQLWPEWKAEREDKLLLTDIELAVLRIVFEKVQNPDQTDNEVFGSSSPVKKGDSWKPNTALLADGFKDSGYDVKPEKILGSVTVLDRKSVNGVDSLIVEAALEMEGIMQLNNFGPIENKTKIRFVSDFPVDASLPAGTGELYLHTTMQGERLGNNNVKVKVAGKGERTKTATEIRKLPEEVKAPAK